MNIINKQDGSAIVEISLLMPLIVICTVLVMKLTISLQLQMSMAEASSQISEVISNRKEIFNGNLSQEDFNDILSIFPNIEKNKISMFIEERKYSSQEYRLLSKTYSGEPSCTLENKLPSLNLKNSFNKYQSVYRVTLCKKFKGDGFDMLPDDLTEISFSTVNLGRHH